MRSDTSYPDPWVQEGQKGGPVGFWALAIHFWGNLIKQKLLGIPNLVGVGHLTGPQIQTRAQCASGAMVPHIQGEFIK